MRSTTLILLAALAATLAGCGGSKQGGGARVTGAGSTLVEPLVSTWQKPLQKQLGIDVVYSGVGSGAGIQQITSRTVDFGASDAPLTPDQAAACKGCVQIPWALSATTVAYAVPGVKNGLHLTGTVVAGIFLGKITRWNDPQIAKLNPGVSLPGTKITPVYRSDGSGDTYAFTDYLARVSGEWKSRVGTSTQVSFPAGEGGKGNSGVAGVISRTAGAIGYLSAAYALPNGLDVADVQNAAGTFVPPSLPSIAAAGATVTSVPANNEMHIVDPPASAANAYPISTFTYVIVPQKTPKAALLRKFVNWAVTSGQAQAFTKPLVFAPVPPAVERAAKRTLAGLG